MRSSFVVVANRLPVDAVDGPDGRTWRRSPGGLVTALHPVLAAQRGSWVGWSGATPGEGEPEEPTPFEVDGIDVFPIDLSGPEIEHYYEGFSNASLWPLYHDAVETPVYKRKWWDVYARINARFADEVAKIIPKTWFPAAQYHSSKDIFAFMQMLKAGFYTGIYASAPVTSQNQFPVVTPWTAEIAAGEKKDR